LVLDCVPGPLALPPEPLPDVFACDEPFELDDEDDDDFEDDDFAAAACVVTFACFDPERYGAGSTGVPFTRVSKWTCGPVQLPVQPTYPITWP
jgi:hypothetical protein